MRRVKRFYIAPADIDTVQRKARGKARRAALTAAGCSTYVLGLRDGQPCILCVCCGLGSMNAGDIEERYCGFCHEFHAEWRDEDV